MKKEKLVDKKNMQKELSLQLLEVVKAFVQPSSDDKKIKRYIKEASKVIVKALFKSEKRTKKVTKSETASSSKIKPTKAERRSRNSETTTKRTSSHPVYKKQL